LVAELCTVDQLQKLLRAARERAGKGKRREVRISGAKAAVVFEPLRSALDLAHLDVQAGYDLVSPHSRSSDRITAS
jgi:hypothetical protein